MEKFSNAITRTLKFIHDRGALNSADVAALLGVRAEQVSRWNQGRAFPRTSTQKLLLDLRYVVDLLSDFYEPQETRLWLFSREKLLKGKSPATLIQAGCIDEVIENINQLRDEIFI